LAVTNPRSHLSGPQAGAVVQAVKTTFASSFGTAMVGGAVMLVVCSVMVWVFQDRDRDRDRPRPLAPGHEGAEPAPAQ